MESDTATLIGLRKELEEIISRAEEIKTKCKIISEELLQSRFEQEACQHLLKAYDIVPKIFQLIKDYNHAIDEFNQIMKKRNIREIEKIDIGSDERLKLLEEYCEDLKRMSDSPTPNIFSIISTFILSLSTVSEISSFALTKSKRAIEVIEHLISSLPPEERDRLNGIRQQVENIKNEKIKHDLLTSIKECEHGFYLGSCLITARVIDYVIDKIPGDDINKKIEFLKKSGTEDKDINEFILKGFKKARNYLTHEPGSSASSEDSLFLLAGCVKLVKLLEKIKESSV